MLVQSLHLCLTFVVVVVVFVVAFVIVVVIVVIFVSGSIFRNTVN